MQFDLMLRQKFCTPNLQVGENRHNTAKPIDVCNKCILLSQSAALKPGLIMCMTKWARGSRARRSNEEVDVLLAGVLSVRCNGL